ncbi:MULTISPECIES: tRNA dimethylallyltransferase [unclassified Flavonifractor]|uniref:tRNA dimethylallyltransferase n=1 Tax=unclassified Flavonifractor TaxID=2629267 RepID=UPI0023B9745E|nr:MULTISPECIES: tRNA dimethylallyltransferase [unclassified Flavonifractor]
MGCITYFFRRKPSNAPSCFLPLFYKINGCSRKIRWNKLGVNFPRETVCQRIDDRLQARIDAGMIEEVAGLREAGATDEFLEGLGLEYRYILRYLKGEIPSLDALKDELGRAIKRFAKRQVQWFNRDRDVLWLDMEGDFLTQAVRAVEQFLKEP